VFAAPTAQGSLITGTVQNVKVETDSTTGVTTVVVTILTQRVLYKPCVSAWRLLYQLLVTDSITGLPINPGSIGSQITIDPTTILTDTITVQQHPVGSALAEFFGELVGWITRPSWNTMMKAWSGVIARPLDDEETGR
jgi:hypothetical protein